MRGLEQGPSGLYAPGWQAKPACPSGEVPYGDGCITELSDDSRDSICAGVRFGLDREQWEPWLECNKTVVYVTAGALLYLILLTSGRRRY
jgi:hypothetical protein